MVSSAATAPETDPRYRLDDPVDAAKTFMNDPMHQPFPVSPLYESVHGPGICIGFATAFGELNVPMDGYEIRYRNHFQFDRFVPKDFSSHEEAMAAGQLAEETLKAQLPIMRERWDTEHLPRLREIHAEFEKLAAGDRTTLPSPEVVDTIRALYAEMWQIHFRIAVPMLLSMQVFDEFYAELFGADADSHALLSGVYTNSIETGIAMSDLAALARELGISDEIMNAPPEAIISTLQTSSEGRQFLDQLDRFLDELGMRQDIIEFRYPTWRENPATVLQSIQGYIASGRDNRAEHQLRAQRADEAINASRTSLAAYPEPVRGQFEALLSFARTAGFLQEEHNFYIDQKGSALARLALLRIGEQLNGAGLLAMPDDVFLLHFDEIKALLAGETIDLSAVIEDRKRTLQIAEQETPPRFIGMPPDGAPPPDSPLTRGLGRFFGVPPKPVSDPNVVPGTAGSRGQVTAPAFVARTLETATAIPPGHILVTITTTPPWTPLFGLAAGIVTETGGPLSHCAIVAREYAIPAVVGAAGALERISTGQVITVDGSRGMVTLHP